MRLNTALRLMGARQEKLERLEAGRIASRIGFDVNQMDGAIFSILRNFLSSVFLVIVVVGFMVFINPWLTLVVLATMPITAILSMVSYSKLREFSREESDRVADLTATTAETFGALKVIRVFASEGSSSPACKNAARRCAMRGFTTGRAFTRSTSCSPAQQPRR